MERAQRFSADSLFFECMLTRHFLSDSDYDWVVEYQVVTVSAVMWALQKESVFVTRIKKTHTEPTVRDNHLFFSTKLKVV